MSDRPPVIGLTTYRERARWGVWDLVADVLPVDYADSIRAAGGVAVLVPPVADEADAAALLDRVDALVVSGGADIEPRRYRADPHPRTSRWYEDRDASELLLLGAAARTRRPVLGICRGMQLMAVAAGGDLEQHQPDVVGTDEHSPGGSEYGEVEVRIVPGSALHGIVGPCLRVSCHHHQAVRSHPDFVPAGHAADGTLEAMESTTLPWLGVQWHPEVRPDTGLFDALVALARDPGGGWR